MLDILEGGRAEEALRAGEAAEYQPSSSTRRPPTLDGVRMVGRFGLWFELEGCIVTTIALTSSIGVPDIIMIGVGCSTHLDSALPWASAWY